MIFLKSLKEPVSISQSTLDMPLIACHTWMNHFQLRVQDNQNAQKKC